MKLKNVLYGVFFIILFISWYGIAQEPSYWERFKNYFTREIGTPKPDLKPSEQPTPKTTPITPHEPEILEEEQLYIKLLKCLIELHYEGARLQCFTEKSMAPLMQWPSIQKLVKLKNLFDSFPTASDDFKRGIHFLTPSVKNLKVTFVGPDKQDDVKKDIELIKKTAIESVKKAKDEELSAQALDKIIHKQGGVKKDIELIKIAIESAKKAKEEGISAETLDKILISSSLLKTGLQNLLSLDYKKLLGDVSYTLFGVGHILKGVKDTLVKSNEIYDTATGKQLALIFNNIEIIIYNVGKIIVPLSTTKLNDLNPLTTQNIFNIAKNSARISETVTQLAQNGESIVNNVKNIERDAKDIETSVKSIIDTVDSKNNFKKLQEKLLQPLSVKLEKVQLPQVSFSLNPFEWKKQAQQAWTTSQNIISIAFESPQLIKGQINTVIIKPMNEIFDHAKKIVKEAQELLMNVADMYTGLKTNLEVQILPLPYVEALARISGALINLDALLDQFSASSLIQ